MRKIVLIIIFSFFSCNKKKIIELDVEIINKKIIVNCKDNSCLDLSYKKINENNLTKVRFKIENTSNYNYIFNPISDNFKKGNVTFFSFPKIFSGLSLNNFILKTESNETVKIEDNVTVLGGESECDFNYEKKMIGYFEKLGYTNDTKTLFKALSMENLILIPKETTLYFESYISLPYNLSSQDINSLEAVKLNSNEKYTIQMVFSADKEVVKKSLPENLKRTIKEGNFKIFDGTIYSNEIPIEILTE